MFPVSNIIGALVTLIVVIVLVYVVLQLVD